MVWWVIALVIIASAAVSYAVSALTPMPNYENSQEGSKVDDLSVQSSAYGRVIPILYGTMRFASNIIWSTDIKEHKFVTQSQASVSGGKGGGGKKSATTTTTTEYKYNVCCAIAICEGVIDRISRMWADTTELAFDSSIFTIYRGTETQNPDPLIQAREGVGKTPAYRGLAYIVIKDFWLTDYGNRIPNFTFEVIRNVFQKDAVQDKITEIIVIPGSGEFVYDTVSNYYCPSYYNNGVLTASGKKKAANISTISQKADAVVAMEHLKDTCKNIKWIAPVANWFVDSDIAGTSNIVPKTEFRADPNNVKYGYWESYPSLWSCNIWNRRNAPQTKIIPSDDMMTYGGTPSDSSVTRYLQYCKNTLGYNIMFYPMLLVDQITPTLKPWRGRIKPRNTNDVNSFFNRQYGYNYYIMHYAALVKDYADAFVIGSELVGLTSFYVKTTENGLTTRTFPAVAEFKKLAKKVKDYFKSVGKGHIKVIYAADWSEYHHADDGWFNMDELWADDNIDIIGIDNYMPLTPDLEQASINYDKIIEGWQSGEGWDYWCDEGNNREKHPFDSPVYAWKNIEYWWTHKHTNPNGELTAWTPRKKPLWFTEFGFPSVDACTNQPNVFVDPFSVENFLPRMSSGRVNYIAQRMAIEATIDFWTKHPERKNGLAEKMFLWTWDARPYPEWPQRKLKWGDWQSWRTGHWIQGKIGSMVNLVQMINDILVNSGIPEERLILNDLGEADECKGYLINKRTTYRKIIEELANIYFFDAVESDGSLKFTMRKNCKIIKIIKKEDIVPTENEGMKEILVITRNQGNELPRKVNVTYSSYSRDYLECTASANRDSYSPPDNEMTIEISQISMDIQQARRIAEQTLYSIWSQRNKYAFKLTKKHLDIEPLDLLEIDLEDGQPNHIVKILSIEYNRPGILDIKAVSENTDIYNTIDDILVDWNLGIAEEADVAVATETYYEFLDLPLLLAEEDPKVGRIKIALCGDSKNWNGADVHRSDDGGITYDLIGGNDLAHTMGFCLNVLGDFNCPIIDYRNELIVSLAGGELENIDKTKLFNGVNLAVVGNEIIQFQHISQEGFESADSYKLTGLIRGLYGTEYYCNKHTEGEKFILLTNNIKPTSFPLTYINANKYYKVVTTGKELEETDAITFQYRGNIFKPYAPCHITATRNANNDLIINWTRRTRIGGDWRDNVDILLGEDFEKYNIEILDANNRNRVKRIIEVKDIQNAVYTAEQQQLDFGEVQSSIKFKIYQLSAIVGAGYEKEMVV